jgi:hypothetical protein
MNDLIQKMMNKSIGNVDKEKIEKKEDIEDIKYYAW